MYHLLTLLRRKARADVKTLREKKSQEIPENRKIEN